MFSAFGWVLFGFAVWALCIFMHALQARFAPEWNKGKAGQNWWDFMWANDSSNDRADSGHETQQQSKDAEIRDLKARIETLEAIVTDKRYQFDEELRRS